MIRFQSDAAGDVLMLDAPAAEILRAIGRNGSSQGVLMPEQLQGAILALEAAVERAEAEVKAPEAMEPEAADESADPWPPQPAVSLRQRAYPVLEMLRRALAQKKRITWGV